MESYLPSIQEKGFIGKRGMLLVLSIKELHLAGFRRQSFSAVAPILDTLLEIPQNMAVL